MQLAEQEIILPLKKTSLLAPLLAMSVLYLTIFGLSLWNVITVVMRNTHDLSGIEIASPIVFGLVYIGYITLVIRKLRAPAQTLRVSHEGIFFSVLIPWDEITAISLHLTTLDEAKMRISVRDRDALYARHLEENRSGIVARSMLRAIFWLSRHTSRQRTHVVNIPGYLLPLSVYELIPEIRARFATELQEHHITIREWGH